jgi:hypothetical protein
VRHVNRVAIFTEFFVDVTKNVASDKIRVVATGIYPCADNFFSRIFDVTKAERGNDDMLTTWQFFPIFLLTLLKMWPLAPGNWRGEYGNCSLWRLLSKARNWVYRYMVFGIKSGGHLKLTKFPLQSLSAIAALKLGWIRKSNFYFEKYEINTIIKIYLAIFRNNNFVKFRK